MFLLFNICSVVKLLNRIVTPDLEGIKEGGSQKDLALHLHDYTHGIHSDPLLHLCMTFSALIHDVGKSTTRHNVGLVSPCAYHSLHSFVLFHAIDHRGVS